MLPTSKIKDIDALAELLAGSCTGQAIVQCHGVFDLMHIGHIRHFQEAKKAGDVLVVTVTPDRFVNKGPHRPVFSETLRAEAIAALDCVDYVAINKWPTAVDAIALLRPNVYAKGADYRDTAQDHTGGILLERNAVEACGGRLVFTDEISFSSSTLLNQHMSNLPDEVNRYLGQFRERYTAASVTTLLKQAQTLKALVIGEAIIDEYQYCETLGKSGKEPILAAQYLRGERFIGGSLAVANHVASCCGEVTLLTLLGTEESHEAMIRSTLAPNVTPVMIQMPGAPTLLKRRFIETYPFQKLFEIYIMDEDAAQARSHEVCERLDAMIADFDVVIVPTTVTGCSARVW